MSLKQPTMGDPLAWGLGEGLTNPHPPPPKKNLTYSYITKDFVPGENAAWGQFAACCGNGKELAGIEKYGEFIGQLRNYQLFKKNCAPCRQLAKN